MLLAIITAIIAAIVIGVAIAAVAPDVLGIEKRKPRHRAEPRKATK